ncbi:integral membrane protein [Colletotrichum sojae]|uniref:Integral membrane protein n=1 Tax=Colletotrichum sojae TaxID=2175907 RepID=A0A8H6J2F7_9PEZI|nr:integral membrane protein [Colletotrichum sojae]
MAPMVENRGPELLGVNIFFTVAAIIATALRCYVRAGIVKAFGRDDWLMVLALLFFVAYSSFSSVGVRYGTGRHFTDLPKEGIRSAMECWFYCYLFYALSMITSKMSIAYFLLRIATRKIHIWIIYTAMLFTVLAGFVFFLVTLFQCMPVSYFWNKDLDGKCIDVNVVIALAYLYSAFSVISDLTFAILPGFLVWGLQLKRRAKLALIPLLVMGCVASSAVVVRFGYLMKLKDPDFLWSTLDIAIWSSVEQGLAITAGSLATIRPLLKIVGWKLGLTTNPSRMRMTDDISRRPSAFMGTGLSGTQTKSVNATSQQQQQQQQPQQRADSPEDAYGMSIFPCKCCGHFKCQKRDSGISSKSKRRSSLGFPSPCRKKEEARVLSNVKSVTESEEDLSMGRTREDSHDAERVVPKSFLTGNVEQKY